jgi:hypothetical protein
MMLIERNRIHPRELTYVPYETRTSEMPRLAAARRPPGCARTWVTRTLSALIACG